MGGKVLIQPFLFPRRRRPQREAERLSLDREQRGSNGSHVQTAAFPVGRLTAYRSPYLPPAAVAMSWPLANGPSPNRWPIGLCPAAVMLSVGAELAACSELSALFD